MRIISRSTWRELQCPGGSRDGRFFFTGDPNWRERPELGRVADSHLGSDRVNRWRRNHARPIQNCSIYRRISIEKTHDDRAGRIGTGAQGQIEAPA